MAHTPWSRWILAPYSAILVILQLWTLPHSFISYRKFSFSLVCWHLQGKRIVDVKETVSIIYTGQILQDKFLSVCVQMAFIDRLLNLWYLLYHVDILSAEWLRPSKFCSTHKKSKKTLILCNFFYHQTDMWPWAGHLFYFFIVKILELSRS